MNNITKWLKSITEEQFTEFFMICNPSCDDCPAKYFCCAKQDGRCCEEEFYQWAIMEGGDNENSSKREYELFKCCKHSEEACCGNCIHFKNEDIDGNGWCAILEYSESVSHLCPTWEWKGGEK